MKREFLLAGAALAAMLSASPALAAGCGTGAARPLMVGMVEPVASNAAGKYSVDLGDGQGVLIDLTTTSLDTASDDSSGKAAAGALMVCDARGAVLAPLASEVFASGGSLTSDGEGVHLRFVAPAAGKYTIAFASAEGARELLLRTRDLPKTERKVTDLEMGGSDFAKVSSEKPLQYAFPGKAGQWVKITATSDNDTVLHLAAPGPDGYEVIADNDDSDGLNPVIRKRLPATGTYYVQVESLTSDEADATVLVQPTDAPPPPPPPTALKAGATFTGKLEPGKDKMVFALPVQAGHTYRAEASATYDVVLEAGVDNPIASDDVDDDGFSSISSQDSGTEGTERLVFTARSTGKILVRVRAYGLSESSDGEDSDASSSAGGDFKLTVTDGGM